MPWHKKIIGLAASLFGLTALSAGQVVSTAPAAVASQHPSYDPGSVSRAELETFRHNGDLPSQRRHVWDLLAYLTHPAGAGARPAFESWYGEDAVFATARAPHLSRGIRAFSRVSSDQDSAVSHGALGSPSADTPVLTYTLYNDAAYHHMRAQRLHLQATLKRLRKNGPKDGSIVGDRSVPSFPTRAMVLKTAWWPVAREGLTALPVWDPERNAPRRGGNPYTTWPRVVAVDPIGTGAAERTAIDFAGESFAQAKRVGLDQFYHVMVDADLAERLAREDGASKLAMLVLGRPIAAGDYLVLVGANLATKEINDWVWAALWWHDAGDQGPFAADRPATLQSAWRHYLMQVAFDADAPTAADGGPHVCFNPWLEGRFPDGGHGGGTVSNCMACHRRASYPPVAFLPVARGAPQVTRDSAYAPGQLRTNFIWSIALHAKP